VAVGSNLLLRWGLALSIVLAVAAMTLGAADRVTRCGGVSDFVAPTATGGGSFVLTTSDGPLRVVVSARTQLSGLADYACVAVVPGARAAGFAGLVAPGSEGYVPEGGAPAGLGSLPGPLLAIVALGLLAPTAFAILIAYRLRPGGVRIAHR
jgi:hypothetical protein